MQSDRCECLILVKKIKHVIRHRTVIKLNVSHFAYALDGYKIAI